MATIYTNITENKLKTGFWISFFLVLTVALGYVLSSVFDIAILFPIALVVASIQGVAAYWWSDKIALATNGAREISKKDAPELYRLIENLSIASGLPIPRIYIIDDESPNAFATGRNPKHAAIAVTQGLLKKLDKSELEGVLAHEFSHIGNDDILLSTAIVILVGSIVMVSDWFLRVSVWNDDDNNNNPYMLIIGVVSALLSPVFASLIQLAISRKREFLADASGALLTRNPNGLADALEKISSDSTPLKRAGNATAHLYISDPLKEKKGSSRSWFSKLFSTHPDVNERIAKLREMAK